MRKAGLKLKLSGQPFQVLAILLEHPGRIVTREDLQKRLWPDTFVDVDHNLNTAINKIREALGDSAENARFVETLPRRGYRFIAPVEGRAPAGPAEEVEKGSVVAGMSRPAGALTLKWRRDLPLVLGAATVLLILVIVGVLVQSRRSAAAPLIHSIAVLPLENLSHDPDQEYFADGITDELITDLTKIRSLRVISHTSVVQYRGTRKPLPQIARELGVDAVVEGSVVRFGDRVRIRAQLVDARADQHIWADSYERNLHDVIAVQNELAREIAGEIRIQLTPQEQANLVATVPSVPEAYEDYLRSRYFINNRRTVEGVRKSVEYSRKAIQLDPHYPLGYAGLAHSLISLSFLGGMTSKEAMPQADAAARRALELDASLSQAHTALALIRTMYDWDWSAAEKELRRALELNPNDPDAHKAYANYLLAIGQTSEAVEEARRSLQLDPFSVLTNRNLGRTLFLARRYDDAIAQFQRVAEMDPQSAVLFNWIAWSYESKGMAREAVRFDLQDRVNNGLSPENAKALQQALSASGPEGYWETLLHKSHAAEKDAFALALINARLGRKEKAFAWLKLACEQRSVWMTWVKVDPTLDPLRSDPEFAGVLRCINMAQ